MDGSMRALVVLALALALLVTIFAVQNYQITQIHFLFWQIDGSLALVLMLTLILGILIGVLLMLPGSIRQRLEVAGLKRSIKDAPAEQPAPPTPEEPESLGPSIQGRADTSSDNPTPNDR